MCILDSNNLVSEEIIDNYVPTKVISTEYPKSLCLSIFSFFLFTYLVAIHSMTKLTVALATSCLECKLKISNLSPSTRSSDIRSIYTNLCFCKHKLA